MLTAVALSVRTRAVTVIDTGTAIGEQSVETIGDLLAEPAGEPEQNFGFAPEATDRRGPVVFTAAKEDRSQ
jgi:hypothetical protein